jgi:hypothetical protein
MMAFFVDLNDALDELRRVIPPYMEDGQPGEGSGQSNARKLSKINTIILATNRHVFGEMEYIGLN